METKLSTFRPLWHEPLKFPEFTGTRILMMPVDLSYTHGVPAQYKPLYRLLTSMVERRFSGEDPRTRSRTGQYVIGYLTIDERELQPGQTLRRPGWHVDGYYQGRCGAWGGGIMLIGDSGACIGLLSIMGVDKDRSDAISDELMTRLLATSDSQAAKDVRVEQNTRTRGQDQ